MSFSMVQLNAHSRVIRALILRLIQILYAVSMHIKSETGKNSTSFLLKTVCSLFRAFMANILSLKIMMVLNVIEILQEPGKNSDGNIEIDLNKAYV